MTGQIPVASIQRCSQRRLREVLNTAGRRLTPQREKVLSLFQGLGPGHHLTADDVHHHLKQSGHRVSLATVYRSLKLLVAMRLLDEGEWQEGLRCYELRQGGSQVHHHMVCMHCDHTEEFISEVITAASRDVCKVTGFELTEVRLILRGICRRCRQRSTEGTPRLPRPSHPPTSSTSMDPMDCRPMLPTTAPVPLQPVGPG